MTRPLSILIVEPDRFSPRARARLSETGVVREEAVADRAALLKAVAGVDVLVVRLAYRLDEEVFAAAPQLRAIVTPTTGLTHIDLEAARARGITVLSLKGETAFLESITATAELTWGLLLALLRKIPVAGNAVRAGEWNRDAWRGVELKDKTLGLIGLGRLGRMVAAYGHAFRMNVMAHDPSPERIPEGVRMVSLASLCESADVISVHAALNDSSRGMLDAAAFRRMKVGACLINTARGEIIDESALLDALRSGRLAGAALDVLAGEPFAGRAALEAHPLWQYAAAHDQLLLTPHIGGATRESMEQTELFMADKLCRWARTLAGGTGDPT